MVSTIMNYHNELNIPAANGTMVIKLSIFSRYGQALNAILVSLVKATPGPMEGNLLIKYVYNVSKSVI